MFYSKCHISECGVSWRDPCGWSGGSKSEKLGGGAGSVPSPRWGSGKPGAPGEPEGCRGSRLSSIHQLLSVRQESFVGLRVLALSMPEVVILR